MTMKRAVWALPLIAMGGIAGADDRPSYTLYGSTGLIEMPNGRMAPEGEVAVTITRFGDQRRNNFSFQVTPRLSATFRYTNIDNFRGPGTDEFFDRSFDLSYQIVQETDRLPSVTIGLRDFLGTGLYSSEYIVASKSFGDRIIVSGGIGWGRLGSEGGFENPLTIFGEDFGDRPVVDFGEGGELRTEEWFRGDAAFFGGISYQLTDKWIIEAEYSSDAYERTTSRGTFTPESPFNFGATYRPNENFEFGLHYLYGTEIGFTATFALNPHDRPNVGGREPAPLPVRARNGTAAAASWQSGQPDVPIIRDPRLQVQAMGQILAADGIRLIAMNSSGSSVRVQFESERYRALSQAIGHVARALTHVMPPEVEVFILEPVERGIPLSAVTVRRSDLEVLENRPGATEASFQRAQFSYGGGSDDLYPVAPAERFTWGIAPYVTVSTFDAENPLLYDLGLEVSAAYEFAPNLVLSGAVRQRLVGNLSDSQVVRDSGLPRVRSNISFYQDAATTLDYLTLAYYFRPGDDLYGRVTAGYLEPMFGGISTELLWKPVDSRLALGAEVNFVAQRNFDQMLGFQDYEVATGHVSVYYDFTNGFHGQVDVGRYLAGDWGATFALDREFANGWRIGGYFTLTDASAEDFGEGSFDKGIRVTIPTDWFLGVPTRREQTTVLRSLTRDGGARLEVDGRLYSIVREGHTPRLEETWARYWR